MLHLFNWTARWGFSLSSTLCNISYRHWFLFRKKKKERKNKKKERKKRKMSTTGQGVRPFLGTIMKTARRASDVHSSRESRSGHRLPFGCCHIPLPGSCLIRWGHALTWCNTVNGGTGPAQVLGDSKKLVLGSHRGKHLQKGALSLSVGLGTVLVALEDTKMNIIRSFLSIW